MFKNLYDEVVFGNQYSLDNDVIQHNVMLENQKVKIGEMPEIEEQFIENGHKGYTLNYAMALFKKMRDAGIKNSYIAFSYEIDSLTGKRTAPHFSVYCREEGSWCIADPGEQLKRGGEFSAIPVKVFKQVNGTVWIYDPYGEHSEKEFFKEFLKFPILVLE